MQVKKEARPTASCLVPFGKYKGVAVRHLVRDTSYTKWLLSQSWFKKHKIYKAVICEFNRKNNTSVGKSKVYFVVNEQLTRMKIGTSIHPEKRLGSIQTGNADRLILYGMILGDRDFEKELHAEFADHRLIGEWFEFEPCKHRVDELLGRDRTIRPGKNYSQQEFFWITGLSERDLDRAEWLADQAGFGSYRTSMQDGNTLRVYNAPNRDKISGTVWCKIVESGCLKRK